MENQYSNEFFKKSPTAYSYHRVILDVRGLPTDYEFLGLNQAYEKLMGIKASDVQYKKFYDVFPTGWKGESQWKDTFNHAILKRTTTHLDMNHYSIQKWIRVTVFPLAHDLFACEYHDVTKEYLLGKEIEGFLAVYPDMLCIANTDWKFLKVNQKFEYVLGYTAPELEEKSFASLYDISSVQDVMKDLQEQNPIINFVNRVLCKDGSYRYLEWRSQPNGKYIYASARDITEKLLKEKKLIQLTEDLQKKNKILKTLAVTDELTGLYNRHYMDKIIDEEMSNSDKKHHPLTMIILDLDHFKQVNDKWGHPIGDKVLKHIANVTQNIIRKSDILARFGGEEFVILLPNTTIREGLIVAEKIRIKLESSSYPPVGTATASLGVAERKQYQSFHCWYKRADEALYLAKKGGRNKVVASDYRGHLPVVTVHLEWKRDWECGHKEIDQQHMELVKQGDRLIFLSLANADHKQILEQLNAVLKTITDHFVEEEQTLKKLGYPEYQEHAAIHQSLIQKALKLKRSYLNGELRPTSFFTFIVNDIIIGHMLESDAEYYSYISQVQNK